MNNMNTWLFQVMGTVCVHLRVKRQLCPAALFASPLMERVKHIQAVPKIPLQTLSGEAAGYSVSHSAEHAGLSHLL